MFRLFCWCTLLGNKELCPRDTKAYPLVFKDNIAFDFHRNALGLRPIGIGVTVICIIWVLFNAKLLLFTTPYVNLSEFVKITPNSLIALGVSLIIIGDVDFLAYRRICKACRIFVRGGCTLKLRSAQVIIASSQ